MSNAEHHNFHLSHVNKNHAQTIFDLCKNDGGDDIIDCPLADITVWSEDHAGIVATDSSGAIAAFCFFKKMDLPVAGGARPVYGTTPVLYIHHQVVAKRYRNLGLGRRVGEATVALAYATLSGPFPSCVACTFLDSASSLLSQRKAGMLVVPQWESAIIDSFPALRALDSQAWETKARIGSVREHAVEFFRRDELFRIAHWMTIAFAFPFRDTTHNITLQMIDPSDGRGNFRRAVRSLACREVTALARLAGYYVPPRCA